MSKMRGAKKKEKDGYAEELVKYMDSNFDVIRDVLLDSYLKGLEDGIQIQMKRDAKDVKK